MAILVIPCCFMDIAKATPSPVPITTPMRAPKTDNRLLLTPALLMGGKIASGARRPSRQMAQSGNSVTELPSSFATKTSPPLTATPSAV